MLLDILAKLNLFLPLDIGEALDNRAVVDVFFKLRQTVEVGLPAAADLFGDKSGKLGIAKSQPCRLYTSAGADEG